MSTPTPDSSQTPSVTSAPVLAPAATPIPSAPTKENLRALGGLWTKTSATGEVFLSGEIQMKNINGSDERVSILIFKNSDKLKVTSPDYNMVLNRFEVEKRVVKKDFF